MFRLHSAIGALLISSALSAAPIPGLYNTGVDAGGIKLAGGNGVAEIHWLQNGTTAYTFSVGSPPYVAEVLPFPGSDRSRWISMDGSGGPGGSYTVPFTLSFDLTGYLPGTASLAGRWAVDNCGSANLNGRAAFSTISDCSASASFDSWTPFSITSGFVAGINTLTFNMTNSLILGFIPSAAAIRVEFLESNVTAAPEPATFGLLGGALVIVGALRRRKRQ